MVWECHIIFMDYQACIKCRLINISLVCIFPDVCETSCFLYQDSSVGVLL